MTERVAARSYHLETFNAWISIRVGEILWQMIES